MIFVDVGFGNCVEISKLISVSRVDSAPIKRMAQKAKDEGRFIDLTQGRKTRSYIVSSDNRGMVVMGSASTPVTIIERMEKTKIKYEKALLHEKPCVEYAFGMPALDEISEEETPAG